MATTATEGVVRGSLVTAAVLGLVLMAAWRSDTELIPPTAAVLAPLLTAVVAGPFVVAMSGTAALVVTVYLSVDNDFSSEAIVSRALVIAIGSTLGVVLARFRVELRGEREFADGFAHLATMLSNTSEATQMADNAAREIAQWLGAVNVNIAFTFHEEQLLTVANSSLAGSPVQLPSTRIDREEERPLTDAIRARRAVVWTKADIARRGTERLLAVNTPDVATIVALPLHESEHNLTGAIGIAFGEVVEVTVSNLEQYQRIASVVALGLERAHEFDREARSARDLQRAMLPSELPHIDSLTLDASYEAGVDGIEVGGDWYDAIDFGEKGLGLAIGDVTGRGLSAARGMALARNGLLSIAYEHESPGAVLNRVNRFVAEQTDDLVTCLYACVVVVAGRCTVASAGHPPILVVPPRGPARFLEVKPGPPLGAAPEVDFEDQWFAVTPGSHLIAYTDGLVERRRIPLGDQLERLRTTATALVRAGGGDLAHRLTVTMDANRAGDDTAVLVAAIAPHETARLDVTLPAEASRLSHVRAEIGFWLCGLGVPEVRADEIVVVISELAANVARHAYRHTNGSDEATMRITLEANAVDVSVRVEDHGRWRPRMRPHDGRGLTMALALVENLEFESSADGTVVTALVPIA